ncbi:hypothetical protein [Herbaspirillum huttiense]|uniref:hypothetical protein n=1 Tax=Herbaspirillum huttiense TaxID=863372 RepID=UPI0039B0EE3B
MKTTNDLNPKAASASTLFCAGLIALVMPVVMLAAYQTPPGPGQFDWARVSAWLCCMTGILSLLALTGSQLRGRYGGIFIDERNRYSLARLQMSMWTIAVLGSVYVVFMSNAIRGEPKFDALGVEIDWELLTLMGLSAASFLGSPLALSRKSEQSSPVDEVADLNRQLVPQQNLSGPVSAVGQLMTKDQPSDARISDLVRGEDIRSAATIDLPRVQMLLITMVIVLGYCAAMIYLLGRGDWLIGKLPTLSPTVLLLAMVSHSGYIAGKLLPSATGDAQPVPQSISRAVTVSQKASALAAELTASLARLSRDDPHRTILQNALPQVRMLADEAATLPSRASFAGFDVQQISLMEVRLETLRKSVTSMQDLAPVVVNAPAPETVHKVQSKLAATGFPVLITGIADLQTESAITKWCQDNGVDRSRLHPNRMRHYEELAQRI